MGNESGERTFDFNASIRMTHIFFSTDNVDLTLRGLELAMIDAKTCTFRPFFYKNYKMFIFSVSFILTAYHDA